MSNPISILRFALFSLLLVFANTTLHAETSATVKQVVELENKAEEISQQADLEKKNPRRQHPLSSLIAIQDAMEERDLKKAAQFMDMRYLPKHLQEEGAEELLRKLGIIWRQQK